MNEMKTQVRRYNQATIIDSPSHNALTSVREDDFVVCSHLARSISSAKALGFEQIHLSDRLFREVDLPYVEFGRVWLPVNWWAYLYRVLSFFGFSANGESISMAKKRAKQAASELIKLANKHDPVVFVGHGLLNQLIAKELLSNSWVGPKKMDPSHWGVGVYERHRSS